MTGRKPLVARGFSRLWSVTTQEAFQTYFSGLDFVLEFLTHRRSVEHKTKVVKSFRFVPECVIGLMRDYVTCSKFTTKPRLYDIFSNFRFPRVVFTWVFLSSWLLWELAHDKIWILHYPAKRGLVVIFARLMSSHTRAIQANPNLLPVSYVFVLRHCRSANQRCTVGLVTMRKWQSSAVIVTEVKHNLPKSTSSRSQRA